MAVERRRYRKVLTRMHGDEKFRQLSRPKPNGQTLWQHLITGPHTTAVPGLSSIGEAALAEALGWPLPGFRKVWQEIVALQMAEADWKARVVWLPNAIRHNAPESPNVIRGWRDTLDIIPECPLKSRAIGELRSFVEGMGEPFGKAFRELSTNPLANQEQEQEIGRGNGKGGNGKPDVLSDPVFLDRVGNFRERYPEIYRKVRNGAYYHVKEARDFDPMCLLVQHYGDAGTNDSRLDLMLDVFLRMEAREANNVPGTPGQFLHMAPEVDRRLREHGK